MVGNRCRLVGRVALQSAVTDAQRDHMYRMLSRQTPDGVTRADFEAALARSQWAALVWGQESRQLCGFATLEVRRGRVAGEVFTAFMLPAMAVDGSFGSPVTLARLLLWHALWIAHNSPGGRFFWAADPTGTGIGDLQRALLLHTAAPGEQARLDTLFWTTPATCWAAVSTLNLTPLARRLLGYPSSPAARPANGVVRSR